MPLICYKPKRFSADSLSLIYQANMIIDEYLDQGFCLTLRQIYYQFVSRDLFPDDRKWKWTGARWIKDAKGTKNATPNYKWIGSILSDARNAGLVDWSAIEDRTRELRELPHWNSTADIVASCASQFRFDLWIDQRYRPEVWIEKDALLGVFEPTCQSLDVPLFSCRGYTSQSEIWNAGRRLSEAIDNGQIPIILHFGDHDPSGIDMTRDIAERLGLYAEKEIEVKRLALNMDQIREHNPPPNPAKATDSRYSSYVSMYGNESWELDALEPAVLTTLVRQQVRSLRDDGLWESAIQRQNKAREQLRKLAESIE